MYKLLIVDDEPLVQVGIKSIINYQDLGICIVGVADNGNTALEMIGELSPDIVMLDIKIPIIDGLELMEIVKLEYKFPPVYIILTSFEDFEYARRAMGSGAQDYLLKIELNPELLTKTLLKTIEQLQSREKPAAEDSLSENIQNKSTLSDSFFIKLLNNWFSSQDEIDEMMSDLQIDCSGEHFLALYFDVAADDVKKAKQNVQNIAQYMLNIIQDICSKYFKSYVVPWNFCSFAVIAILPEAPVWGDSENLVLKCIRHVQNVVFKYQNLSLFSGVGSVVTSLSQVSNSLSESIAASKSCDETVKYVIFDRIISEKPYHNIFNIAIFREELATALNSYDVLKLQSVFNDLINLITTYSTRLEQSIAVCSTVLHFVIIFYNDSDQLIQEIFGDRYKAYYDLYYDLYKLKTGAQVTAWLTTFKEGLSRRLLADLEKSKNWLVPHIKKYIEEHYNEPLSLSEVARAFDISSGYVSSIFKKYNDIGFTECVTQAKIKHASQLLLQPNAKIYEVSNMLGYSDPYYFSKVFKRSTGLSPREYIIRNSIR